MDSQKSQLLLEKINTLYKSIYLSGGDMSPIERDLMLSYVRQFYDSILNGAQVSPPPVPKPTPKPTPKPKKATPKPTPKVETPPPPPAPKVEVVETPPPPPPPVVETPKVEVAPPPPPPKPAPAKVAIPAQFNELFEIKQGTELSDKLSAQAVKDLTKAVSINDRLLFQGNLFNNNASDLNAALKELNNANDFNHAKEILVRLANQNSWLDESKKKWARQFVKLSRRRFA